ncbi:MAG TPA: response regulator [Thermoanaerobaculia bacterium]|jgi:CheY-like chemotaxis protein
MYADDTIHILAVDDNAGKLLALSTVLSELPVEVVTADSGREALRLLLRQEFAVILLDVHMPGMDGFETASLIRQRKNTEHTPIIFVTSFPDDTHAARGYSLGAVDYILAPVDPEVLKTKVLVFVELYRKTTQVRLQADILARRAAQLHRLTQASLAINSALSLDQMIQVVADMARDLLSVEQATALAAPDQKWSSPRTAVSLSAGWRETGERPAVRDRANLLRLLSSARGILRVPAGGDAGEWDGILSSEAREAGWLASPLTGRDGRNIGLLQLVGKHEAEFSAEDEAILTQFAQMSSIALENALNAEAREANRMKDEFLTTLSHELRTPLSAILGWTRLLRADRRSPRRVMDGLEIIERNVMAQTRLINDLLDVSRIITGKLRLQVQSTSLSEVIEAAMESMRPAAGGKEIRLRFENRLGADSDRIVGDPDRLQQIIWNLISNSIKFTPPRGTVDVTVERRNGEFEIAVQDTGQGMTPEFLAQAFDRFRQADSSTSRAHGGLGIGLAIARHLTELHGGSIAAESAGPERGSRFVVRVPSVAIGLESAESPAPSGLPAAREPAHPAIRLKGVRVLLVEDQWDSRELMVEILRLAGADVTAAGSAPEAMEALAAAAPDVLVSDIGMPGEDGYALLRRLRGSAPARFASIPAIAVSAYAREEDRIRSLSAGFQLHIAKPFEPVELVAAVDRVVRRNAASPEPAVAVVVPEPSPAPVLIVEDNGDLREGMRQLLQEWGHEVELAENGHQAIARCMEARTRPRVALIDIGLPDVNGFEVARRIRSVLGPSEIYLVALTGHATSADLQMAVESGFDVHMAKPIKFEKLRELLETRLTRSN